MQERSGIILVLLVVGILAALAIVAPPSKLGGCISLNLIKNQVNKSTLGSYCWTDNSGSYCLIRKEK